MVARVVKAAADRQDEILDAAQALFVRLGYDATPVQAIIDEVGIAKGTFYHHYPSKAALLDALVVRLVEQSMALVVPIVEDPHLNAVEKLNRIYQRLGVWKTERRDVLIDMQRALNAPANAGMMRRLQQESMAVFAPLMARVIAQGVNEGVFDTRWPDRAARYLGDLGIGLSTGLSRALLSDPAKRPPRGWLDEEIDAFHDAVERILGAPPGSVQYVDKAIVALWFEETGGWP